MSGNDGRGGNAPQPQMMQYPPPGMMAQGPQGQLVPGQPPMFMSPQPHGKQLVGAGAPPGTVQPQMSMTSPAFQNFMAAAAAANGQPPQQPPMAGMLPAGYPPQVMAAAGYPPQQILPPGSFFDPRTGQLMMAAGGGGPPLPIVPLASAAASPPTMTNGNVSIPQNPDAFPGNSPPMSRESTVSHQTVPGATGGNDGGSVMSPQSNPQLLSPSFSDVKSPVSTYSAAPSPVTSPLLRSSSQIEHGVRKQLCVFVVRTSLLFPVCVCVLRHSLSITRFTS